MGDALVSQRLGCFGVAVHAPMSAKRRDFYGATSTLLKVRAVYEGESPRAEVCARGPGDPEIHLADAWGNGVNLS